MNIALVLMLAVTLFSAPLQQQQAESLSGSIPLGGVEDKLVVVEFYVCDEGRAVFVTIDIDEEGPLVPEAWVLWDGIPGNAFPIQIDELQDVERVRSWFLFYPGMKLGTEIDGNELFILQDGNRLTIFPRFELSQAEDGGLEIVNWR